MYVRHSFNVNSYKYFVFFGKIMNYNRYRWCVVSSCTNTSIKTPEKLFMKVPDDIEMRNVWLELAKRDPKSLSTKSRLYLCEDHFNLEQDMENYMEYKIMGFVKHVKMKVNTIPSRFCFHTENKCRLSPSTSQLTLTKIQRLDFVQLTENSKLSEDHVEPTATSSKSDQTRDAITSPGVSQCDKDLVESEAPQTNTNAPEDMIECTYSSSTESALSDEDGPSTFTTYEEPRNSKNDDNHKPRSDQAAIETTATTQHSEVNRIVELELEEEVQSRANKSNTQTTDERKGREEIIEQYKCYRIIANVYHYLNEEYEWLKRQSGALYDVSALSDIPARTAAAAGVSRHSLARALRHHRTRAAIRADHTYGKGIARTNTTRTKSKMAGFSVRMRRKGGTHSHTLKKKQENDGNDGERVRPSKKRTTKSSNRNKPRDMEQLLSKNRQSKGSVPSRKRPTNEEVHGGENMGPPKRRSTRISVRSKPCEEEQLPFPSPIQLRVHGVMETEYKIEPADDECPPAIGDDPLETESWSHHPHCEPHCEQALTTEETETLFKTEPPDDDCLEDLKPDPLELESSAALEEPCDSPDTTQLEVKFECVDEDMDMSKDYSIFDHTPLDIKPEPPE